MGLSTDETKLGLTISSCSFFSRHAFLDYIWIFICLDDVSEDAPSTKPYTLLSFARMLTAAPPVAWTKELQRGSCSLSFGVNEAKFWNTLRPSGTRRGKQHTQIF